MWISLTFDLDLSWCLVALQVVELKDPDLATQWQNSSVAEVARLVLAKAGDAGGRRGTVEGCRGWRFPARHGGSPSHHPMLFMGFSMD